MSNKNFDDEPLYPGFQSLSEFYRSNPEQFFKVITKVVHDSGTPSSHADALMLYAIHEAHRSGKVHELSNVIATWSYGVGAGLLFNF